MGISPEFIEWLRENGIEGALEWLYDMARTTPYKSMQADSLAKAMIIESMIEVKNER